MTAIREGLMRPFIAVDIEVHQPVSGPSKAFSRSFTGHLKGAMYNAGVLHHVRVVDADGVLWMVPPAWLPLYSLRVAEMAVDRVDAQFLDILQTIPHDVIWSTMKRVLHIPDHMTTCEATAYLARRRQAELVH